LVAAKAAGPRKRLRCLVLDDPRSICLGNEPVRIDGRIVGRVTSGGYGYAVERSIAFAYLPPDARIGTRGEIDVFGEWVGFEVAREPLYDPAGQRIRACPGRRAWTSPPATGRSGAPASPGRRSRSWMRGWSSPRPPATRPTGSPATRSVATSRSRRSRTGRA